MILPWLEHGNLSTYLSRRQPDETRRLEIVCMDLSQPSRSWCIYTYGTHRPRTPPTALRTFMGYRSPFVMVTLNRYDSKYGLSITATDCHCAIRETLLSMTLNERSLAISAPRGSPGRKHRRSWHRRLMAQHGTAARKQKKQVALHLKAMFGLGVVYFCM